MPFKPPDNPKCPKCGKSVYAAEERLAGGQKWHKTCFKCALCNKMLDSTNCTEHDGELFCKVCHARKFGPKGYGFGGGAGCLSMDTGEQFQNKEGSVSANTWQAPNTTCIRAKDGEGCPRCGGAVFAAEQMLTKGRQWHKGCFKCKACSKYLDSTTHCDGPDRDIYCRSCYGKYFGPKGYGFGQGAGILQSDESILNGDQYLANKPHTDTTSIMAIEGEGCPRCGGKVYAAEEVLAKGRGWHRKCFNCCECSKTLDSINACNGPDKAKPEVYCKTCYGKKYGPKGYGFACGSGFLQTDILPNEQNDTQKPAYAQDCSKIKAPPGEGCPRCGGAVYAAEQMLAKGSVWHKGCFSCAECRRPLDSILSCDGPDKEIYCKPCYGKRFGPKGYGYGVTLVSTTGESTAPTETGPGEKAPEGEGCGRCGFAVYAAEQMLSRGRLWHRRCFFCSECHRSLDSTNVNDSPDGEIYCKGCYARKYGPKGVGFGMGAGALQMIQ